MPTGSTVKVLHRHRAIAKQAPSRRTNSFWQTLQQDLEVHDGDWTRPGFRAIAVHRFGEWRMGIRRRWMRVPFSLLYRLLYRRVRNNYGIELPYTVKLGQRVIIEHQGGIVIHGLCEIGDDCIIRQNVTLGIRNLKDLKAVPKLGAGVEIGAGAVLLGDISVGDGAKIGANSVVLDSVPTGRTVTGAPARLTSVAIAKRSFG